MKTHFIILFSFLFVCSLNAQVTNFGVSSGTQGDGSSFFGYAAGASNTVEGKNNTFVGHKTGGSNYTGINNSFLGYLAGSNHEKGSNNTFVGTESGHNSANSQHNTFVGMGSGLSTTSSKYNVYLGMYAGRSNKTGAGNVSVGYTAGNSYSSSSYNTFVGHESGYKFQEGGSNTCLGRRSGYSMAATKGNVYVGSQAGESNEQGSGNVFLGNQAGQNEMGSSKLYIDNSSTTNPLIYGDFTGNKLGVNTSTIPSGYTMAVDGKIIAEEVRVQLSPNWPDFVFEPTYDLMPISELKKYIDENKHLPDMPSAEEMENAGGQDVGEMNRLLLQKVEELSLYIIQQQAQIDELMKK